MKEKRKNNNQNHIGEDLEELLDHHTPADMNVPSYTEELFDGDEGHQIIRETGQEIYIKE